MPKILLLLLLASLVACASPSTAPAPQTAASASQTAAAAADAVQPAFRVPAAPVLDGDPIDLRLVGFPANAAVTVTAERVWGRRDPARYRSKAKFRADADGTIDFARDAPIAAPWVGVDPRGLFWSMTRTEEALSDDEPDSSTVVLRADADGDGQVDGTNDLRAAVTLIRSVEGLVETPLGDDFPGAFLVRPPGDAPLPVVIVLGGSEGQDSAARDAAPRLASRGYAAVGLPYYSPAWADQPQPIPGLPRAFRDIPIDRLEGVRDWLRARDDIQSDRIGLYGVSKGAEFVLAGASRIDGFAAVVAIVPSDVIWEGWGSSADDGPYSSFSWRGASLPFVPYKGMAEEFAKGQNGGEVRIRIPHDAGREAYPERVAPARIAVEQIDEPLLIAGADEDWVWNSGAMARNILAVRDAAGLRTVAFIDPDADHALSGTAYRPIGNAATARLRGVAYPAMLDFFAIHLKGETLRRRDTGR